LSAILAFLKSLYEHKEKVIMGVLFVAFVSVAYVQIKAKRKADSENDGESSGGSILEFKEKRPREAKKYSVPSFGNPFDIEKHRELFKGRDIFAKPVKERPGRKKDEKEEWAQIRVKSVFDPTQSGSYIAIIEVDKKSRIVKEGDQFGAYEVERVDGVRNCLTIYWREAKEVESKKEFCKEE